MKNIRVFEKFPTTVWGKRVPISIWKFSKPMGGGLNFSKISELYIIPRPHPKKEKEKHSICPFSMSMCLLRCLSEVV